MSKKSEVSSDLRALSLPLDVFSRRSKIYYLPGSTLSTIFSAPDGSTVQTSNFFKLPERCYSNDPKQIQRSKCDLSTLA